ncbi:ATP-binding protein [Zavarzinella formosa]|uniref:ATP-binding protein n=1 Tax=Zavarzinella formosa TaxID=360055 RepID=UPI0002E2544C|nr:ATP-binding protein [Zavarzinella formosa]
MLIACCSKSETTFELPNDPALVPGLVAYICDAMAMMKLCEEKILIRISIALTEAIDNALHHGNLELSSSLREGDGSQWRETGALRRTVSPYRDRRIHVSVSVNRQRALVVIRDEGPGFDVSILPDPTDWENTERPSGRGVFLMRAFMDEVTYNPQGNELTLVKHRQK